MVLEPDEVRIETSPAAFFANSESSYKGKLTLTNRRLVYEGAEDGVRSAVEPDEAVRWSGDRSFEIDRKSICCVEFDDDGPTKTFTVLTEESSLSFDVGTSNVEKIRASFEGPSRKTVRPLSLPAKLFRVIACTLVFIVVSDIAGVIAATVVDILGSVLRDFSGMLIMYGIWFVFGGLTGFFIHWAGGGFATGPAKANWPYVPGAVKTGFLVCSVALPIVAGLAYLSAILSWDSESVYVPGNTGLSVAYFLAVAIGVIFAQFVVMYKPKPAR